MRDDYPTSAELQSILDFEGTPAEFVELINGMWWAEGFHVERKRKTKLENAHYLCSLSTWGWSGNEEIVGVLRQTWFWMLWWSKSRRGGHFQFEIPADTYNAKFQFNYGMPHSAVEHELDLSKLLKSIPRATLHHKSVDGISTYTARISVSGKRKTSPNTVLKVVADTPEDALQELSKKLKGE